MKPVKVWLSRRRTGNYMMTYLRPVLCTVYGTDFKEFYMVHGEPVGVDQLCSAGVLRFYGVDLKPGEQVQKYCQGIYIDGAENIVKGDK